MFRQKKQVIIVGNTAKTAYLVNIIKEVYQNPPIGVFWVLTKEDEQKLDTSKADIILYTGESPKLVRFFRTRKNPRAHVVTFYDKESIPDIMYDLDMHLSNKFFFNITPNFKYESEE